VLDTTHVGTHTRLQLEVTVLHSLRSHVDTMFSKNRTEVNTSLFSVFTCTHQILRLHVRLVSKTISNRTISWNHMPNELKDKTNGKGILVKQNLI
jgi:hypothetical protein